MTSEDQVEQSSGKEEVKQIPLKIKLPKYVLAEKELELLLLPSETLGDLKDAINASIVTQNLTNFNIFYEEVNLSNEFDSNASFEEMFRVLNVAEPSVLRLRLGEKPYNLAGVYEHINKFREVIGLHYLDKMNTSFGALSGLTKFNQVALEEVKESTQKQDDESSSGEASQETPETESVISPQEKEEITRITEALVSLDGGLLASYGEFSNLVRDIKPPIKTLSLSQWLPVPPARKAKGDLLYLTLQTVENETFNITCHATGFYVNRCSTVNFNPSIKSNDGGKVYKDFLLINLVDALSPSFSNIIQENEEKLFASSKYAESYLIPSNSFLSNPWLLNPALGSFQPDLSRSQAPLVTNGVDGADFVKEWNEDFQSIRELPKNNFNERILREKLLNKLFHEFKTTATKVAMDIVYGNIQPLNPQEPPELHIYLRNGIFYSLSANATGAFDESGGNEAARYTSTKDLASIKLLNRADIDGIFNLLTCIVDFLGKRVVCQAPVPGIFQDSVSDDDENADKVQYGLTTDGSKVLNDHSFDAVLKNFAGIFHLKPHEVEMKNDIKSDGELLISKDIKGIKGTDNRKYLIDLYRTTPLDIGFIRKHYENDNAESYPHKETLLRHEAVEEWWKRKFALLLKDETERLEKEGKLEDKSEGEKPQIVLPADAVTINTDSFTTENENQKDQDEISSISDFLINVLIEEFLQESATLIAPFDGYHLSSILHKLGINMRYLGYIAEQCLLRKTNYLKKLDETIALNEAAIQAQAKEDKQKNEQKQKEDETSSSEASKEDGVETKKEETTKGEFEPYIANFESLYRVCVQEMVARAVKHVMRKLSAHLPTLVLQHFVVHFHNCLFGGEVHPTPVCVVDESIQDMCSSKDLEFLSLDSKKVVDLITREIFIRFRHTLPENWMTSIIEPGQLMREIAIKFGIQWKARDYIFDKDEFEASVRIAQTRIAEEKKTLKKSNKKKQASLDLDHNVRTTIFTSEDVVSFVPIIKDSSYRAGLVDEIFESARAQIIQGEKDTGLALLSNLLLIYEQIYGRVHPETSKFYGSLSQYYSELGLASEACAMARKACILSERTMGFDSFETLTAYINAAYFEGVNESITNSLNLYMKVIDDWSHVYGRNHPSLVNTYANLAELLSEKKLFKPAFKLFEKAISVSKVINGDESQITGMLSYRFGGSLLAKGDFKSALKEFEVCHNIFAKLIDPKDILSTKTGSFITNIKAYLAYNEVQEKKKASVKGSSNGKTKLKSSYTRVQQNAKKNKKTSASPDPEISSKPIDEILDYIEGNHSNKSSKRKGRK